MTESKICTCPSGDGSLRWPCPKHPAVEQAGGDERAAFEAAFAAMGRPVCRADYDQDAYGTPFDDGGWTGWQARAALAQPSPVRSSLLINGYQLRAALDFIAPDGTAEQLESEACIEWRQQDADFLEAGLYAFCAEYPEEGGVLLDEEPTTAQPSPLQSEQAEAERPEVAEVAFVLRNIGAMDAEDIDGDNVDLRFEDAEGRDTGCDVSIVEYAEKAADLFEQHDRIVGELRADRDSWAEQAEQRLADWDEMRKERDAALARVAELERQEPVALANRGLHAFWVKWTEAAAGLYGPGIKLYAAPVAQAQQLNDLDKQCRDDVARALGLRPNQERGFAWSYLLASIKSCVKASGDSAQAQHSVPGDIMRDAQRYRWLRDQQFYFSFSTENSDAGISSCTAGMSSRFKNLSWVDAAIDSAIAAAPGKEVGHE
ncbi:hypothetical protein IPC339_04035 [Pseudomonas aeruginosa]|uniref:hypothetical protein n=1 Tax=Pseudomonas aeruginosa TaxID=287 RepID=UPI000F5213B3|nr:hypothetical protein [Pseudomonas aeruginosa]RQD26019.1 hypothetical protein IPC339_04035 [Pseudomonas aeruginosa]RQF03322.1 hypothetical protein IPC289_02190 [Pseudomonas aeruginosa]HCG1251608.1 hypothetical protein [Pseudomonas aeruginosa]HEP8987451.1 hypothetical protein [Pseudomonas aeruginosa]